MAALGQKFVHGLTAPKSKNAFELYYNEIFHTTNTIILEQGDVGVVFLTHDSPNYLRTNSSSLVAHSKTWFEHMTSHVSQNQ